MDIAIGQVWRRKNGSEATIVQRRDDLGLWADNNGFLYDRFGNAFQGTTSAHPVLPAWSLDGCVSKSQPVLEAAGMDVAGYECLADVLLRAYDQSARGKGKERHGRDQPFNQQPMQELIGLYGGGFALGQAAKKAQESMRLPKDRAVVELLGAIVYLAGAVIALENSQ